MSHQTRRRRSVRDHVIAEPDVLAPLRQDWAADLHEGVVEGGKDINGAKASLLFAEEG